MLLILIVVLAAAAGILGDLLEFALWAIVILALVGALLGYAAYRWITGFTERTRGPG